MVNQGSWNLDAGGLCLTHGYFTTNPGSIQNHIHANLPCDFTNYTRISRINQNRPPDTVPTLPPQPPTRTLTSDGTIHATDYAIYANPSGSAMRILLPVDAAFRGRIVNVKKVGTNSRPVRLMGTIDRSTSAKLVSDGDSATIQNVGSVWRVL